MVHDSYVLFLSLASKGESIAFVTVRYQNNIIIDVVYVVSSSTGGIILDPENTFGGISVIVVSSVSADLIFVPTNLSRLQVTSGSKITGIHEV